MDPRSTLAITIGLTVALAGGAFLTRSDEPAAAGPTSSIGSPDAASDTTPTTVVNVPTTAATATTVVITPPATVPATSTTSTTVATTTTTTTTSTTAVTPTTTVPPTTTTTVPPTTTTTLGGPQPVAYTFRELPIEPGLLCADLAAQGVDYRTVVLYWYREGYPELDADGDNIPCEDDYDTATVDDYWSGDHPEAGLLNVARQLDGCGYAVTHVLAIERFPDGSHDIAVSVDVDLDGTADVDTTFNTFAGWEVYPIGADLEVGEALLFCEY